MVELEFTENYATYKAGKTGKFNRLLASRILKLGVAKIKVKKQRKSKKEE
jgi:hypothetical protein